mgnify:CR=1 FL=1
MQELTLGTSDLTCLAAEMKGHLDSLTYKESGSSMLPTLIDGDILKVVPVETGSIAPGDILLYRTDDKRAAVHRVARISVSDDYQISLTISSDARPGARYVIPPDSVLGRIEEARRGSREIPLDYSCSRMFRNALNYCRLIVVSLIRRFAVRCNSVITSIRPFRRIFRFLIRPFVKYRMIPQENTPSDRESECTWELFQASIGRIVIGQAQLVRFKPGTAFSSYQWLFSMRVRSIFRGSGIGRRLTCNIIERASKNSNIDLCLIVSPDNTRAVNLYRSLGFTTEGSVKNMKTILEHIGRDHLLMILGTYPNT